VKTVERDFFAQRLTRTELEELARAAGGIRAIFGVGSERFRALGRPPESFTDRELLDLAMEEPRFLRRPLLVTDDGRVLAGAKAVGSAG